MDAQQPARALAAQVLRVLLRVIPRRHHVVLTATPADEGNVVELVRALSARYSGPIVWLEAPDDERLRQLGLEPARIRRYRKWSLTGVLAFLSAEAVFFTHGIFGYPRPVAGKALVNLWHGDGPKDEVRTRVPSSYVVSGSEVFGHRRAANFGVEPDRVILSGLPRLEQLRRPADEEQLRLLGLREDQPFVVWMPTFRRSAVPHPGGAGDDTDDRQSDADLAALLAPGAAALVRLGLQVVVKPHPLDATPRHHPGLVVLTDADLRSAATTLYALLGASSGLLTDYSSVWTDYVALDRPIAFFVPDAEVYAAGRGLHPPDTLDWLPGSTVQTPDDFSAFGREVLQPADARGRDRRARARQHFGLVQPRNPTNRLLEALAERGVLTLVPERTT